MRSVPLIVACLMILPPAAPVAGQGSAPNVARSLAATCANCHGTNGVSAGEVVSLAGRPKDEIVRKMQDFKAGRVPGNDHAAAREGLHGRADRSRRRVVRGATGELRRRTCACSEGSSCKAIGAASTIAAIPGLRDDRRREQQGRGRRRRLRRRDRGQVHPPVGRRADRRDRRRAQRRVHLVPAVEPRARRQQDARRCHDELRSPGAAPRREDRPGHGERRSTSSGAA